MIPFRRKQLWVLGSLLFALCVMVVLAAFTGVVSIPILSVFSGSLEKEQVAVLLSIRFPRILLACAVGMSLAISGAALQGLFRNPLADPGLIGISSGAALAVAVLLVLGGNAFGALGLYSLSIGAFLGGIVTCWIILKIAQHNDTVSMSYMLFTGIALNALAGAGVGFLLYMSDNEQLRTLTFWTMGTLGGALWPSVVVMVTIAVPSMVFLMRFAGQLNIFLLGEKEAWHLGVDSGRLKRRIIVCVSLLIGSCVAVSGIIGFIGLVVPHILRLSIGADNRLLLPSCCLLGALLLLSADTLSRIVIAPAEMPVGIITSLVGGPFFLWLLVRSKQMKGAV